MSRGRMQAQIRIVGLLGLLEQIRVPWTLDALAARFGVSTRTIRRDLEALEAAGVAVGRCLIQRDPISRVAAVESIRWKCVGVDVGLEGGDRAVVWAPRVPS